MNGRIIDGELEAVKRQRDEANDMLVELRAALGRAVSAMEAFAHLLDPHRFSLDIDVATRREEIDAAFDVRDTILADPECKDAGEAWRELELLRNGLIAWRDEFIDLDSESTFGPFIAAEIERRFPAVAKVAARRGGSMKYEQQADRDAASGADEIKREARMHKPRPAHIRCPWCDTRHIDIGEWETRPHHKHLCTACKKLFRVEGGHGEYFYGTPDDDHYAGAGHDVPRRDA